MFKAFTHSTIYGAKPCRHLIWHNNKNLQYSSQLFSVHIYNVMASMRRHTVLAGKWILGLIIIFGDKFVGPLETNVVIHTWPAKGSDWLILGNWMFWLIYFCSRLGSAQRPGASHATVSVGKGFGSKGKQHHKHTATETQSHTHWSLQIQRTIMKFYQHSSDHAQITAFPPLISVFLALHGNEVVSGTTWSANTDLKRRQNISCYSFASAWLCGSA